MYHFIKRCMDLAVSGNVLVLLIPVFVMTAAAIRFWSPGPIFYCGPRVGLHGRRFHVYKFRTMVIDADRRGGSATADDDPRLTRIGLMLRKFKIDELPQLLNVLQGDMSLVGPRPEVEKYVSMYSGEERQILTVRPGITDWASLWNFEEGAVLAGSDDPERAYEQLIRPTKLKLQLKYVREQSLTTDLLILYHTAMKLTFRDRWVPGVLKHYARSYGVPTPGANGVPEAGKVLGTEDIRSKAMPASSCAPGQPDSSPSVRHS